MDDAFTIGARLKQEAIEAQNQNKDASWQMLRSDIYVRDKGICWICNTYVELKDYDLGHLVDRCNGGKDDYDNLAVMHKSCNLSKPKHNTLEEAMKWKLTPTYLSERPISMFDGSKSIGNGYPYHKKKTTVPQLSLPTDTDKDNANKQLINSYFQAHPELTDTANVVRLEAIKLLSQILNIPENSVIPQSIPQQTLNRPLLEWDVPITKKRGIPHYSYQLSPVKLAKQEKEYEENSKRIVPGTICWMQGRPLSIGGTKSPMWIVVIPPYGKEDKFIMRKTPPGAIDNGNNDIYKTIQVLNAELKQDVDVFIGSIGYRISQKDGFIKVKPIKISTSNNGNTNQTIGMGRNQIPIKAWGIAKSSGFSLAEFKALYWLNPTEFS
jgi:hypothetical protein